MGVYDDFYVDNKTNDDLGSFFTITKESDFIQKVTINEINLVETSYGNVLEVVIAQGEKITKGWYINETKEDYEYNGKTITTKMQNDTAKAKLAQLGRALIGESFSFTPTEKSFKGVVDGLKIALKDVLGKKEIYARLTLNNQFANLATKDGRTFSEKKEDLSIPLKDIQKLSALKNNNADPDPDEHKDLDAF